MEKSLLIILLIAAGLALFYFLKAKSTGDSLKPEAFKEKVEEVPGIVIDVRTPKEFNAGHLKLADHNYDLLSGTFEQKLETMDKTETYYLYCRTGNRSGKAAGIMKRNGFEKVYNVGGYQRLVSAGFQDAE